MKKIALLCVLLFLSNYTFSQNLKVSYFENSTISLENLKKTPEYLQFLYKKNTFIFNLEYSNGITHYKNDDFSKLGIKNEEFFKEEKNGDEDEMGNKTINTGTLVDYKSFLLAKEKEYYKDFKKNTMLCLIGGSTNGTQIVDKPFEWNWEITDDTKKISGYTCKKAISKLMGLHFEAWYTDEIPVNAGPEKYDGLPGLILYVKTPGLEIIANSITFKKEAKAIEAPIFKGKTYTFLEALRK